MKKITRPLAVIVIVAVLGFAVLNVLAYAHARAMLRFTAGGARTVKPEKLKFLSKVKVLIAGVNLPRPANRSVPSELAPDCRILSIAGTNGVKLEAWYCDRGKDTPLVILFHGYSAEKTSLLGEAVTFLDLGNSVMLVDFRGSGGSSEAYTTLGVCEADDVGAVVRYARENSSHTGTILFGQSMGAVAILRAVHEDGIRPDAVILEAVFDTMLNTVRNRFHTMRVPSFPSAELLVFWGGFQNGFNGFEHNPVDYASSLNCPALFMHGTDDPRATLAEGRRVFDAVRSPKVFKSFEKTGHESYASARNAEWRATVQDFMAKEVVP